MTAFAKVWGHICFLKHFYSAMMLKLTKRDSKVIYSVTKDL